MKKCPSCQKTYEDNMKFCQSDGTPLVVVAEDTPSDDPFKTMVASDINLPVEGPETPEAAEPKDETPTRPPVREPVSFSPATPPAQESAAPPAQEPATPPAQESAPPPKASPPEPAAPQTPEKSATPPPATSVSDDDENGDVLEIPGETDDADPMKTIVVSSSDTSDNIKVPPAEPATHSPAAPQAPVSPPPPASKPDLEAETMIAPEIPKFSEPDVQPPDLDAGSGIPLPPEKQTPAAPPPETPADSKPSIPIPSPFEESMPPGVAFPEDPPFEQSGTPQPEASQPDAATPPQSPFAEPAGASDASPDEDWDVSTPDEASPATPAVASTSAPSPFGNNSILSVPDPVEPGTEGENKTLAIVSLVSGILSVICCFSVITGPVALITGFMARSKIGQDPATYGGGTFALIGMILGVLGTILFVILVALQFLGALGELNF